MKYKIFDLDGTITPSRQKISPEMKECFKNLKEPFVVISGQSKEQMEYQLDGLECTILSQSGNETPLWQNKLTRHEKKEINTHIEKVLGSYPRYAGAKRKKIEDRGCQISFSFIGHYTDESNREKKKNFDPDRKIRKTVLEVCPFKSKTLVCKIAGTTCFDYTKKDGMKGDNIKRWIMENNIAKEDCVYYGDALFEGGNDASVIGVIETVSVENPEHLLELLK